MKKSLITEIDTIVVPFIFFFSLFSWIFSVVSAENTTIPVRVGVVLDLDSGSGKCGKVYLSFIEMAIKDIYASHPDFKTRSHLQIRNSKGTVVGAAAAALDLINNAQVQAIIGPETSMQTSFVVSMGDQAKVPILSFSASSPYLTSQRSPNFFRLTQNDSIQVKAISGIIRNFEWREVVPIYEDNPYGEGIIPFLIDALQAVGARVPYRSVISHSAKDIEVEKELYKLMTMQTRVFIVHMKPDLCSKLFAKAKEIGMMSKGYVWIVTTGISNRLQSMKVDLNSMQGVLGVQTDVKMKAPKLVAVKRRILRENPNISRGQLDVYGFQAYDAAFALAMAIERVGNTSFQFHKANASFKASNLDTLKVDVSQYGPEVGDALNHITFEGIAGDFNLIEGQIQSSTYKIINVNGNKRKKIASWTPENGMVSASTGKSSINSKCDLGPIMWPGDSFSLPKGWEIPTNSKKLRIGVPVKSGFGEFVRVIKDSKTNTTTITGFCIDVFKAAVEILPYALTYEFFPYENSNGSSAGNYDELVEQVHNGYFDAVVGDTTIRADRSMLVDFTMPYTESDVGMVVPIIDRTSKNAWIFTKPLTCGLWLTTFCFFIFIAFVVWVLEHRVNDDFRGSPSHQVGTSIWFSFSTIVFSHRERVISNLARCVMIVWVFVMLIMTQSYTANLSSMLTVQQLQPTVSELTVLSRNRDNVGYIEHAYTRGLLLKNGFQASQLKAIKSMEDCDEAFTNGTTNGGIAAFVGGTPALKVFVAKYCSKYSLVGPVFKTSGFGFVFPKRSPLLADISQAILNLTEGETLLHIESKWIKQVSNCPESSGPNVSGHSLGLESFWGLFLVAGLTSVLALLICMASFLSKHKHVLRVPDSGSSTWRRIRAICEIFDERHVSSHTTFEKSRKRKRITSVGEHEGRNNNASPNSKWPPESPVSRYSNIRDMDNYSVFFADQQTPSTGGASPETVQTAVFDSKCLELKR